MQLKRVGNCIIFKRPLSYFDRATSGQTKKKNKKDRLKRTKKNERKAERSDLKGKKKRN